jgi:hypothetical protein
MTELPKASSAKPRRFIRAHVYVLACDHRLQRTRPAFQDPNDEARHQEQQHSFSETLLGFLDDGVTFVGEEIDAKHASVARGLAERFRCSYSIIEMPLEERIQNDCGPDYETLNQIDNPENIMRCHRLRELYMCQRVLESLSDGSRGLVLCGNVHAERLSNDLARGVSQVELKTIADYPWFDKQLYRWPE